jgi:hypothetical protein
MASLFVAFVLLCVFNFILALKLNRISTEPLWLLLYVLWCFLSGGLLPQIWRANGWI